MGNDRNNCSIPPTLDGWVYIEPIHGPLDGPLYTWAQYTPTQYTLFHMQSKEVPGSVISYLYVLLHMFQRGYLEKHAYAMGDKYSIEDSYLEMELKVGKRE